MILEVLELHQKAYFDVTFSKHHTLRLMLIIFQEDKNKHLLSLAKGLPS